MTTSTERLFEGADWDFAQLQRIHDACEEIAHGELGLDTYPNQIEIITAEQMLDAYSSAGMPLFYKHWSFGKHFVHHETFYRRGLKGLAYEIVINSSPCISYLMEENTATMQTLVIAHAAFSHNHFFKNNYLFRQWTDASGILDYLDFAKGYVASCGERRYGRHAVEITLDAAHALMSARDPIAIQGKKRSLDLRAEEKRAKERREHEQSVFNDLLAYRSHRACEERRDSGTRSGGANCWGCRRRIFFISWKRPLRRGYSPGSARKPLRIVRHIAQYFYPQRPRPEGHERGRGDLRTLSHHEPPASAGAGSTDGNFLEFLQSHTNVVFQPEFDDQRFSDFNPYALGFAMMQDIERIVTNPDDEDREWFPDIAGAGDVMGVLRQVWANYRRTRASSSVSSCHRG